MSEKTTVQDTRNDLHDGANRLIDSKLKHLALDDKRILWRYRHRLCKKCNHRFHTIEIDIIELKRITDNGDKNEKS